LGGVSKFEISKFNKICARNFAANLANFAAQIFQISCADLPKFRGANLPNFVRKFAKISRRKFAEFQPKFLNFTARISKFYPEISKFHASNPKTPRVKFRNFANLKHPAQKIFKFQINSIKFPNLPNKFAINFRANFSPK